ncbi:hypothetical protein BDB01DRAFT_768390 [Pilobolus umbonatus]|nr:hypothetical protein BDB01DRAFT_768390 [Pilobolus umbonatus]
MRIPPEILHHIAIYLDYHQHYQCLRVNSLWYYSFLPAMYRVIRIVTRRQLKLLLLYLLQHRPTNELIREIHLRKTFESTADGGRLRCVGVTNEEVNQLLSCCPYLEVLEFDAGLWNYLQPDKLIQSKHIRRLAPFTRQSIYQVSTRQFNLTSISLHGSIVSQLYASNELFTMLTGVPLLKQLTIDSQQTISHLILIHHTDIEYIHRILPFLEELNISGSIQLVMDKYTDPVQPASAMRRLKIRGNIPARWVYYWGLKYPHLQEWDMDVNYLLGSRNTDRLNTPPISASELEHLLSHLLIHCPQLRSIKLDSLTAGYYMTQSFFDTAQTHPSLKSIRLTHQSPYNLIHRRSFFKLLSKNGHRFVTGLGTEVMGNDIHIDSMLGDLSVFKQLVDLVLCCGHPFYDCAINVILEQCPQLNSLRIRSARLTVQTKIPFNHPLKLLHLNSIAFTSSLFHFLSAHCQQLNHITLYECYQQSKENSINIHLPFHHLDSLIINGLRLTSQDHHQFIPYAKIMSMQVDGQPLRWYHHHSNHPNPAIRKLNEKRSKMVSDYYQNTPYLSAITNISKLKEDLSFGRISVICQSISHWKLLCNVNYYEY